MDLAVYTRSKVVVLQIVWSMIFVLSVQNQIRLYEIVEPDWAFCSYLMECI